MPFQQFVNTQPAPAVAGDFASRNPRFFVLAGPGGLVAGPQGLVVGRFAWLSNEFDDADEAPSVANNFGAGPIGGFVHREQQALIEVYLQEAGMMIPAGFPCTLHSGGDFWVRNNGTTQAYFGMTAYASFVDGHASFAAPGSAGSASVTGAIAPGTAAFTASITDNVMTVSNVSSGAIVVGGTVAGTNVATGTQVVFQLSGTAGGDGTYAISIPEQTVASEAMTETYGTLTVSNVASGALSVGDTLNTTTPAVITALGTGTGGVGTYIVSPTQTFASGTITVGTSIATKFIAMSSGAPGELVKISSHLLG